MPLTSGLQCNMYKFGLLLMTYVQGSSQGVIALNMEDGMLHRFHAASTILATVSTIFILDLFFLFIKNE